MAASRSIGGHQPKTNDSIAKKYYSIVLQRKLRAAILMVTDRSGGGILLSNDANTKSGSPVIDVLREKHPPIMTPDVEGEGDLSFKSYDKCPAIMPVDCGQDIVMVMAGNLSGDAGPSSVDKLALIKWLLDYGRESQALRKEMAEWVNLLANKSPTCAMYRTIMACRLAALDKQPGMRPLDIGKVWRSTIVKCALMAAVKDTKAACNSLQLCAGLEVRIKGAIAAVLNRVEEEGTMEFGA